MRRPRKAVIPVAGRGTRFLPVTHAVPKELCPLLDVPTLQYVVEEAANAGVEEVILVTAPREEKQAIARYFQDPPPAGDRPGLLRLRELRERVRITTVVQPEPRGLGHAVLCARDAVGDEPFAVLLGDDVFQGPSPTAALGESLVLEGGGGHITLLEVPMAHTHRYGIAVGESLGDGRLKLSGVVEKPTQGTAPSRLAIVGRYVLPPQIFPILSETAPGAGGEIQLTDGLDKLIKGEGLFGVMHAGRRHDAGDVVGYVLANVAFGLARSDVAPGLVEGLQSLLAAHGKNADGA